MAKRTEDSESLVIFKIREGQTYKTLLISEHLQAFRTTTNTFLRYQAHHPNTESSWRYHSTGHTVQPMLQAQEVSVEARNDFFLAWPTTDWTGMAIRSWSAHLMSVMCKLRCHCYFSADLHNWHTLKSHCTALSVHAKDLQEVIKLNIICTGMQRKSNYTFEGFHLAPSPLLLYSQQRVKIQVNKCWELLVGRSFTSSLIRLV